MAKGSTHCTNGIIIQNMVHQLVDCTLHSKRYGFQLLSAMICLFLLPMLAYDAHFLVDWLDLGTS